MNRIWKLGKLNHVAIATKDVKKASFFYKNVLGAKVSDILPLKEHGVKTVFVELGETKLELLEPLDENSPISSFLKTKKDGSLHHICIEVNDISSAIETLVKEKVGILGGNSPKIGAHGKPVVFLNPKDCGGVLVELEQE